MVSRSEPPQLVRVISVKERLTRYNHGRIPGSPLVTAVPIDADGNVTGEQVRFDNGYVVEMVRMAPYRSPRQRRNIFAERPVHSAIVMTSQRNVWFGPLGSLVQRVFQSMWWADLRYPVNHERLEELFWKTTPGLVESVRGQYIRVHRKPFEKWVRKNAHRLICTKAEETRIETEHQTNWEVDAERAIVDDIDDEWREVDAAWDDAIDEYMHDSANLPY